MLLLLDNYHNHLCLLLANIWQDMVRQFFLFLKDFFFIFLNANTALPPKISVLVHSFEVIFIELQ